MVELIVGKKGKGKTKVLLDKVNGVKKRQWKYCLLRQEHKTYV